MTYLDSAVLDLTEWFCRKFQLLTGRTNVWLALQLTNLSIVVYFVWAGLFFWSSDAVWLRVALGVFFSGLLYVLTQTIFKVSIEAYESNAYHRVAKGLRNPRRIRDALLRISFLTLSLVLFYPILFVYINLRVHIAPLSYSLIVLTTVVLYVMACDPLPPCAGKVKEWLRGSAPSRLAASETAGGRAEASLSVPPVGNQGADYRRRVARPAASELLTAGLRKRRSIPVSDVARSTSSRVLIKHENAERAETAEFFS